MWARAVGWFGYEPAAAWDVELWEYRVLDSAHEERERRKDLRAGTIASVMANAWSGKDAAAMTPATFFPWLGEGEDLEMDEEATGEYFKALVVSMGGKVVVVEA